SASRVTAGGRRPGGVSPSPWETKRWSSWSTAARRRSWPRAMARRRSPAAAAGGSASAADASPSSTRPPAPRSFARPSPRGTGSGALGPGTDQAEQTLLDAERALADRLQHPVDGGRHEGRGAQIAQRALGRIVLVGAAPADHLDDLGRHVEPDLGGQVLRLGG